LGATFVISEDAFPHANSDQVKLHSWQTQRVCSLALVSVTRQLQHWGQSSTLTSRVIGGVSLRPHWSLHQSANLPRTIDDRRKTVCTAISQRQDGTPKSFQRFAKRIRAADAKEVAQEMGTEETAAARIKTAPRSGASHSPAVSHLSGDTGLTA